MVGSPNPLHDALAGVPSVAHALRRPAPARIDPGGGAAGSSGAATGASGEQGSGFAAMAAGSNPWRAPRRRSPKQRPPEGGPWRLG